jgi:hypothetical protein
LSDIESALTNAREQERLRLQYATEQSGFVAVIGEADVGKTVLLRRLGMHLESQGMWVVYVDVDGAYAVTELAWLWLRSLARAIVGGIAFSHLTALDHTMWPTRTRSGALTIDEMLGSRLSAIALSNIAPTPHGKDEDREALGEAIEAMGRAASRGQPVLLILDHLEAPMLTPRHPVDVRDLLWMIRAEAQRNSQLRVLVCGRPGVQDDFAGEEAAFFQDGRVVTIERPDAAVWNEVAVAIGHPTGGLARALALTQRHVPTTLQMLRAMWQAPVGTPQADATFAHLAEQQHAHTRRCVQHARTLDRLGGRVLEAVARGQAPYGATAHSHPKQVQRALARLRLAGLIDQDAPRKWRLVDPLVGSQLRGGVSPDAWALEPDETAYTPQS